MSTSINLFKEIVKRTLTVPVKTQVGITLSMGGPYDCSARVRQLDAALMTAGFKMSKDLMEQFNSWDPLVFVDVANDILDAVKELVGDDVKHNVYFKQFPHNIPDTMDFWVEQIVQLFTTGTCAYGKYQHSYEEMLKYHEEFIPSNKDRVTLLHAGGSFREEVGKLYISLAGSSVPLKEADRDLLKVIAEFCLNSKQPEKIPVRENKSIINKVRLDNGKELLVDTVTDVLRLACVISEGDETLVNKTKFKSMPRRVRKQLMKSLEGLLSKASYKLEDVLLHKEAWKRLGEKVHPKEYQQFKNAQDVFAIARNDKKVKTFMGKVESAFAAKDLDTILSLLKNKPGILYRNMDRILTICGSDRAMLTKLREVTKNTSDKVSAKVIFSLNEHLKTRMSVGTFEKRIFTNKKGRAWVADDKRKPLNARSVASMVLDFDDIIVSRLPEDLGTVVHDEAVSNLALPLSDKNNPNGFNIVPKGSVEELQDQDILRFFCYWKQAFRTTDFDLSMIMLNANYEQIDLVSYTNLSSRGGICTHSGDLTTAPKGATEFIDVRLKELDKKVKYLVPVVYIFGGEPFETVEESYFGYMTMDSSQKGKPFEPSTVRMKSDVRGNGKAALPAVFYRTEEGWSTKWVHLFLKGHPRYNRTENTKKSVNLVTKAIMEKQFTSIGDIFAAMSEKGNVGIYDPEKEYSEPITFVGMQKPEGLPEGSKAYTLTNLHELVGLFD